MNRTRPLLAVTLLGAALAVPAQARVVAPPELTESTVITAQRSGYIDVVVPVDATLSPRVERNPDVRLSGSGRFVGFWLERIGSGPEVWDGVSSTRLPAFLGGAQRTYGSAVPTTPCKGVPEAYPVHYDCTEQAVPRAILLHEGRYRLTVLTDSSPLTISLTLHGLDEGTTSLTPRHALASAERSLPQRDGVNDKLITYGATAPVQGNVMTWVAATAKGSADPVLSEESVCIRADEGDAPRLGYGPHCPDGLGGGYAYTVQLADHSYGGMGGFVSASSEPNTRDVGIGGSFGDSGGVTLGQTLGIWLQVPAT